MYKQVSYIITTMSRSHIFTKQIQSYSFILSQLNTFMLLHLKLYSPNLIQTHSTPDLLRIHKINPQWVVSPGWDSSACAAVCTVLRLRCNKFKTQRNKIISHLSLRLHVPGCLLIFPSSCNLQYI